MSRVFLVTGSNKGLGFAIVKLLCQAVSPSDIVYLTSRNIQNGESAVQKLNDIGLKPEFHQLDITDNKSIEALRDDLVARHGGLDVLVNNAGVAASDSDPFAFQAESTVKANFFGTLQVCNVLFPILKQNARVVTVSGLFTLDAFRRLGKNMKSKFGSPALTMEELKIYMQLFVDSAKLDTLSEDGFPRFALGMSKLGQTLMTRIQQRELDSKAGNTIVVNCCCPGYVATEMTKGKGAPPEYGAEVAKYLALLPSDWTGPRGKLWQSNRVVPFLD